MSHFRFAPTQGKPSTGVACIKIDLAVLEFSTHALNIKFSLTVFVENGFLFNEIVKFEDIVLFSPFKTDCLTYIGKLK